MAFAMILLLAGSLTTRGLEAQDAKLRKVAPPDPYTQNSSAALAKAGYVRLGLFPFGSGHSTGDIEALLGTEELCWIETAHFRIGCALSPLKLRGEEDWVRKTKQELKRLAAKMPRVKVETRDLDPWLRAHLIAQRVEDLYSEVLENFGCRDDSFPAAPGDDPARADFRGLGPYLGMRQKFTVLLVRQAGSHARYTKAYHGVAMTDPIRFHDTAYGCMYFGGSEETANRLFADDLALHTHLVFNLAQNLYLCYRCYGHDLPAWLPTGLAHWHARRVSPRFPTYDRRDEKDQKGDRDKLPPSAFWAWETRVHGLMKNGVFEPLSTFLERPTAGEFGIEQHIQAWSLADFLMTNHKEAGMRFWHSMKEPFHQRQRPASPAEVLGRQQERLPGVLGFDSKRLEEAWRAYVLGQKTKK